MRLLTTYACPARSDVVIDATRVIEVWISKVDDQPAEMFYSPYCPAGRLLRPAIVSADELMAAQVHAVRILEAEADSDPVAAELLARGRRLETRTIEGELRSDLREVYDVEDQDGRTLQILLAEMRGGGSKVARVEINDPDDLPRAERVPSHV